MNHEDKGPFQQKMGKGFHFLWRHRIELLSGALMLVGIILTFSFFPNIGGALVGLGFGLCFYKEIHGYFVQLREIYVEQGVFKTLMLIGTVVFLLITVPAFIIATAIGYGAMYLIQKFFPQQPL